MVYQSTVLWLAWDWARSGDFSQQVRGAGLTPGNAEAWDRLGEAVAANFDNAQPAAAISYFEHAVKDNPHSAGNWMDLAQTYEVSGNLAQANTAYEMAQQTYPISAEVSWKYGNFLLRQGQTSKGLAEVHKALVIDPKLVPLAISRVWSFDPDVHVILGDVLPAGEAARFQMLDFLAARRDIGAALEGWKEITALAEAKPINIQDVFPFIQQLIVSEQTAEAQRIWREALTAARWPQSGTTDNSQIWNGGFEEPIANGGLDWRIEQIPGAYISTDSRVHHSGERSLRIDFTGGVNLSFSNVRQVVPVEPNTPYVFQYFLRTESISTKSGVRFEIVDLNHDQVDTMTPDLTGTNPWTPIRMEITTGRDTHFLEIRLCRMPSRLFDNKLSGTAWVDDVSISRDAATEAKSHP